ncbi:MAG: recombination protein O N-terminal domain-containing protein, partial [Gammaproteobacteria bacterium]
MNQSDWESCYLLHQRSYGETSLIVDIFSYSYGRISLVEKGSKKPKSKFFGYIMHFNK